MPADPEPSIPQPDNFKSVVDIFRERREMILYSHLQNSVHLVRFEPGRIEVRPTADAPRDLVNRVSAFLGEWTGRRWLVTVSGETGEETLGDQARAEDQRLIDEAESDDLVRAVKDAFPGSAVTKVTNREPAEIPNAGSLDDDDDSDDED